MDKTAPEKPFVSFPLIAIAGRYPGGQWRLAERIRAAGGQTSAIVHGKCRALVVPNGWVDKPPRKRALVDAITHRVPVIELRDFERALRNEDHLGDLIAPGVAALSRIEENWYRNAAVPKERAHQVTRHDATLDAMAAQQERGSYSLKF